MKFEHVSFNEKFWVTKTEAEFIAHESHHGLSEKQLKEAFALMKPAAPVKLEVISAPVAAIVKADGVVVPGVKKVAGSKIATAKLKKAKS